jgi:hypothetical protein
MEDLAERLARVLSRGETLPLARAQIERTAVRREGDDRSELPAAPAGGIAPQQLDAVEAGRRAVADQLTARQSEAAAAARLGSE